MARDSLDGLLVTPYVYFKFYVEIHVLYQSTFFPNPLRFHCAGVSLWKVWLARCALRRTEGHSLSYDGCKLAASRRGQDKRGRRRSATISHKYLLWQSVARQMYGICSKMCALTQTMATCNVGDLRHFRKTIVCPDPVRKPVRPISLLLRSIFKLRISKFGSNKFWNEGGGFS